MFITGDQRVREHERRAARAARELLRLVPQRPAGGLAFDRVLPPFERSIWSKSFLIILSFIILASGSTGWKLKGQWIILSAY